MCITPIGRTFGTGHRIAKVVAIGASIGLSVWLTGAAFAQVQQAGGPANAPMNNGPAQAGQKDPSDSQNQNDFPAVEVHTAVEANARCAFARANFHRLQYSLDSMIRRMQYDFEHSKDLVDASKAEQQAWENYLAARNEALKPV